MGDEIPVLALSPAPALDDSKVEEERNTSFANIIAFLGTAKYPAGFTPNQKRALRRAAECFTLVNNQLYYIGRDKERQRLVIFDEESKKRIFKDCHTPEGGTVHWGQKKTLERVETHFYWRNMVKEIIDWVQYCPGCAERDKRGGPAAKRAKIAPVEILTDDVIEQSMESAEIDTEQKSEVTKAIERVQNYASKVENRLQTLTDAEKQVKDSAMQVLGDIDDSLDKVLAVLIRSMTRRRDALKSHVFRLRSRALKSIKAQRKGLEARNKTCQSLLEDPEAPNKSDWASKTSFLTTPLPFIQLNEIPFISSNLNLARLERVSGLLEKFGKVGKLTPFHITVIADRPGGFFLRWQMLGVDNESVFDDDTVFYFRLEMQKEGDTDWQEIYNGLNNEFLIKPLPQGVVYTFRVFCRREQDQIWGPPSASVTACCNFSVYRFLPSDDTFELEEDCTLASRTGSGPACLYSSAPQLQPGSEITFRFMGEGKLGADDGIGLVEQWVQGGELVQPGTFFVSALGCVSVNGIEVANLASLIFDSQPVVITLEKLDEDVNNFALKVYLTIGDQKLHFDWSLHCPNLSVYFALKLSAEGVKVKIE